MVSLIKLNGRCCLAKDTNATREREKQLVSYLKEALVIINEWIGLTSLEMRGLTLTLSKGSTVSPFTVNTTTENDPSVTDVLVPQRLLFQS